MAIRVSVSYWHTPIQRLTEYLIQASQALIHYWLVEGIWLLIGLKQLLKTELLLVQLLECSTMVCTNL